MATKFKARSQKTLIGQLRELKRLFRAKSRHTTGPLAVNRKGEMVDVHAPEACRWCFWGATTLICVGDDYDVYRVINEQLGKRKNGYSRSAIAVSEGRNGWARIKKAIDKAIEAHA